MPITQGKALRAVILAAGQGKRMKSGKAKVLHEVLGKPILTRVMEAVAAVPVEHIHIIVGHNHEQVEDYLRKNPPCVPYSTHLQEPQLGTGHALVQVVPSLAGFTGTLLVLVGDAPLLKTATLEELAQAHWKDNGAVSLLTTEVDDARSYGRIVRDGSGKVTGIVEDKDCTPEQKLLKEINPAIYCLEWPAIEPGLSGLKNDNKQGEYYLTDLVSWASKGGLTLADTSCNWKEVSGINSPLELAEAMKILKDEVVHRLASDCGVTIIDPLSTWIAPEAKIGADTIILPGCFIQGEVTIGSGCTIGPNAQLMGPVSIGNLASVSQSVVTRTKIGDGCRVGPFAHLRDGVELGAACRIGNFVELKAAMVGDHTNVSHLSYVGDAELGSNVNVGAGTITANYDKLSGKKSRTVIGDNASTGSNSVLVAPVVLGNDAMVAAGSVVTRDVPDGALAVSRTRQENKEGWVPRRLAQNKVSSR